MFTIESMQWSLCWRLRTFAENVIAGTIGQPQKINNGHAVASWLQRVCVLEVGPRGFRG